MAMVEVEFERKMGAGLKYCGIYINDKKLTFVNDKATCNLPAGEEIDVYWRMMGEPHSTLTIKYTAAGATKTIVKDSKIPKNRSRETDFTYFVL